MRENSLTCEGSNWSVQEKTHLQVKNQIKTIRKIIEDTCKSLNWSVKVLLIANTS